jgi:hypothetical protein
MTTDQLADHLRSEFHRVDQRMLEEGNPDLPSYVVSAPPRSRRWVRVAAVASVAAAVVLLIPILKPSDKVPTARVADAQIVLPGETRGQAVERITRACMIEGGLTPIDVATASDGPQYPIAVYQDSPETKARSEACVRRIEDLGMAEPQMVLPGETPQVAVERISRACMVEGGLTPIDFAVTASENGGPQYPVAVYTEGPYMSARQDICNKRIVALGIIKPPTAEQFAAFYPHVVAFNDCLRANGYDVETVVSMDEYVFSRGNPRASPKLDALGHADDAGPKYRQCLDRELIPYTSIFRM